VAKLESMTGYPIIHGVTDAYFVAEWVGPVHSAWLSLAGRMNVDAAEPSAEGTAPGLDQQPSSPHCHPTKPIQYIVDTCTHTQVMLVFTCLICPNN